MYEKTKQVESQHGEGIDPPNEDQMRDEIQRVSRTLIKLMEVSG
jgi:hypothetical protein